MNEETNNTEIQESANPAPEENTSENAARELNHIYYEIESDLLSKPNALVDLIITNPIPTIIFCNQPSEADLVEVVLNKRQVPCQKLIGRVPSARVLSAAQQVAKGELAALIVTDISARSLDVGTFQRLINYSIHEDPEIYLHRCEPEESKALETVASLISPLDHGNFHYLKKVVDFEMKPAELPSSEEIENAQFNQILNEAKGFQYPDTIDKFEDLHNKLKTADNYDEIVKYALYNMIHVLPELKVKAANRYESDSNQSQYDSGDRIKDDDFNEEESRILNRNIPKKEYVRFYVGTGKDQGNDQEAITKLLVEAANLPAEQICNYIDRGIYAFVDVLKENSAGLVDILDGYEINGSSLVFKKATTIVATVENTDKQSESDESQGNQEEE